MHGRLKGQDTTRSPRPVSNHCPWPSLAGNLSAALAAATSSTAADVNGSDPSHGPSSGPSPQHAFAAGVDGLRGLAATCSELEQVLFAQQLILFAPGAVPPTKHLPLLLLTLSSSRPTLRKAAAATLWHLADRNAAALAQVRLDCTAAFTAHTSPLSAGVRCTAIQVSRVVV